MAKAVKRKPKTKKKIVKKASKVVAKRKKKVSALPKGYNTVTPYIIVNGARKAIAFYKDVFGAKLVLCMDKPNGKIGHAELKFTDSKIMLADEFPEMQALAPKAFGGSPISIHLYVKKVDEVIKKAVSRGAKLLRPAEDMFYGDRSGSIPWARVGSSDFCSGYR